jgi:hypothetical protein
MKKLTGEALFRTPEIVLWNDLAPERYRLEGEIDEAAREAERYINDDLLIADSLESGLCVLHSRAWSVKNSARQPAWQISRGLIPGPYFGRDRYFQTVTITDPHRPDLWTFLVRKSNRG